VIYENNKLSLYLNYDFAEDEYFSKYVRDKITITETVTNQVILEKWVEFEVERNTTNKELGIVWTTDIPTYMTFNFSATYLTEPQISCEPFVTPLPADVVNPLSETPNIIVTSITAAPESCIGGGDSEYIGAAVALNVLAPYNIEVGLLIVYTDGTGSAITNLYVQIPQGQSIGNIFGCENGLYIPGLISVDSVCIDYISDTNIDLNNFGCL
jgi:hypothetical protein